jgi:anthranilate synthase component 1
MLRSTQGLCRRLGVPPGVLRWLAATQPLEFPALFDSVAHGALGRASILAAYPRAALWADPSGRVFAQGTPAAASGFLDALEQWWRREGRTPAAATRSTDLPFAGGWVIFLGYEAAADVEPRLVLPPTPLPWRAFALRPPCALVHDFASDAVFAVAETEDAAELDALERAAYSAAQALARDPLAASASPAAKAGVAGDFRIREEEPARFIERVHRAKEYIRAGDIYQANLSRPWHVDAGPQYLDTPGALATLYARLCTVNPAPFAALAQWGGVALLSSSPERLIRIRGSEVETRPIAGTRPRSRRPEDDAVEAAALVAHPKERAEHIMLIDLERNDLGRVCAPGSVRVDEFMVTETYAHVHHIVSSVRGRLRSDVSPLGAVRAVFPGGTITGCPKYRCMQIIAELEAEGRGAYTGSLGFLSIDGTLDLNILIRTITVARGRMGLRAGAGIVADSDPERELEETRAKARGMLAVFDPP